ncbi:teicoplanin resistance protein VanZ [Paenibacillus borealis]|uniref:Teicoplanin resistance protein VanZ n=2 Tax=Paenibacillus borealis TaxID=160799 RepID=A0A089LA27_PAEBO|nr:VanZ family protein [Paenibacillus borealis]AIQ58336.1 teicoplanin resistance protein VanZ [Paenibacillus borealis]
MFQSYLFPISYAFMAFPLAALLFTLPFLIVQYRRHGYINKIRALVLYLLLLYLLNAFFLVLLPMPESRHNAAPTGHMLQPVPLQFIQDILRNTQLSRNDPSSYLNVLREPDFLLAAFNVALTLPFGLFLGYYFRTRWVVCIILSFGLSLLFEITQITGIYGFFDHPYRIFDVDDLITNTFGGIAGFRIALWISGLLPRIEQLDSQEDLSAKKVTYTRRGLACLLDAVLWTAAGLLLNQLSLNISFWAVSVVYFLIVPLCTRGRTLGKWVVRIRLSSADDGPLKLWMVWVRYGLLYGLLGGINFLILDSALMQSFGTAGSTIIRITAALADLVFIIHLMLRMFKRDRPLFYEQWSRTRNVITWPNPQPAAAGESLAN